MIWLSLFDGMGCGYMAAKRANVPITKYYSSEVDKYAIQQTKQNFPNVTHIGDVREVDVSKLEPIDILIGGSPCFVARTNIICSDNIKPIEDVLAGDYVLTHENRYRKVLAVGSKNVATYNVKAQGLVEMETTAEHPFYVREMKRQWDNSKRTSFRLFSEPIWKEVKDLKKGDFIGMPILQTNSNPLNITKEEAFIIGRYIADGHTRKDFRTTENRPTHRHWQVILSIGSSKLNDFEELIKDNHYSCYLHTENVYRVVFSSKRLVEMVEANCGMGAINKHISKLLLDLPVDLLSTLIDGYLSGDGHEFKPNKFSITTISKDLVLSLGLAILKVYKVGFACSTHTPPKQRLLLGRLVNQNTQYIIQFAKEVTKQANYKVIDDVCWFPVKSVINTGTIERVYNLEVEEDNSYTANGFIVHNCQSFSFAGKRKGMSSSCEVEILKLEQYLQMKADGFEFEGQSYLFWEYMRILKEIQTYNPNVLFLLENVEMAKKWERVLSEAIGIFGAHLNSNRVSAQNRARIFWTNIRTRREGLFGELYSDIPVPEDRGILLKDILEAEVDEKYYLSDKLISGLLKNSPGYEGRFVPHTHETTKSNCLTARYHKMGRTDPYVECIAMRGRNPENPSDRTVGAPTQQRLEPNLTGKTNTLTTVSKDNLVMQINPSLESGGKQPYQQNRIYDTEGISPALCANKADLLVAQHERRIRRLTVKECSRLQTIDEDYKWIVSDTQAYRQLGNGWTVELITHIFNFIPCK